MGHTWVNVKNSTKAGNRPIEDFWDDLDKAFDQFESASGTKVDQSVREAFGSRECAATTLKEKTFSNPLPHITSHKSYIFGCLSVPADIEDGASNFTNVNFLATKDFLVTTINDPHEVYNAYFGAAILDLFTSHITRPKANAAATIMKLVTFSIAAVDHSLEAMSNKLTKNRILFENIDRNDGRKLERSVATRTPIINNLEVEINSLTTVIQQLIEITRRIESDAIRMIDGVGESSFFGEDELRYGSGLHLQALRLGGYLETVKFECRSFLDQLSRSRESSLTMATHRITAFGAAILVPNLLYDYWGQGFASMAEPFKSYGWRISFGITVAYWLLQFWWFKRKRYI